MSGDEQRGIVIVCNECGCAIRAGSICADCALKGWQSQG
jgi:ribosomal protein L32